MSSLDTLSIMNGGILRCKMPPFVVRYVAFWPVVCRLLGSSANLLDGNNA